MTMCDASSSDGIALTVACSTYELERKNFKAGEWLHSPAFRALGVRLYGPNGNNVTHDLEPEGGAFTEDGKYFFTVLQDNNAYAVFDIAAKQFTAMKGLPLIANEPADFSNKDSKINIHATTSHKILMPDQVTSFMNDGKYYFITANEGGTRGEDMIGMSGDFEGEEIRMGKLPCTDATMCTDAEMGRVTTTAFMPSDYAVNACGSNTCDAKQLEAGLDASTAGLRANVKGAGAFKCIYRDADYGGCASFCNPQTVHEMWHDPAGCSVYPDRVGFYIDSVDPNAYYATAYTLPTWSSLAMTSAGVKAVGAMPSLKEDVHSPSPLGYDSAATCQTLCDDVAECSYWYLEFEMNKYKCYLKKAFADSTCHEFSFKTDKFDFATKYWHADYNGTKTFVQEGYANWGGPRSSMCVSPAPYTNAATPAAPAGPGSPGGTITTGGRSFTILELNPTTGDLTMVFDSGSMMETMQRDTVPFGLCTGCELDGGKNAAGNDCKTHCPFNADDSPPNFDARSDAKGPEPECVTTGVMSDGTRLSFVGMERTGGVLTYDISTPASPTYQDYFNVKNHLIDKVGTKPAGVSLPLPAPPVPPVRHLFSHTPS